VDRVQIGRATLYCGDCRDLLASLEPGAVLVTDPPYGLSGTTPKAAYDTDLFEDTPEYVETVCAPVVAACLDRTVRGAVSCGIMNIYRYPPARCIGGFIQPSTASFCTWGLATVNPLLFYGPRPKTRSTIPLHTEVFSSMAETLSGHPCIKPLKPWTWLVNKCTNAGDTVLDPFMGSGTTGVACVALNLPFIGIELEAKYFDLACERIGAAYSQGRMFA
jgi:site-specific DNA-methyltransferase (adenine-specific)